MKCYIMRGLPGSGKSTWISRNISGSPLIASADHFFSKSGQYVFDSTQLANAHNTCLRRFVSFVTDRDPLIAVDNTNLRVSEISPYYRVAEAFGYEVEIIYILADPFMCMERNIHGVPEITIENMSKSIEAIPTWWRQRIVLATA